MNAKEEIAIKHGIIGGFTLHSNRDLAKNALHNCMEDYAKLYHQAKSKEEAMKHEEVINALKDVWRLRDLLIYGSDVAVEHLDEARAIDDLMTRIAKALAAFGKEGEG